MVEDGLGEGLSTGGGSQVGVETERLGDGQVGWKSVSDTQNRAGNSSLPFIVYIGVPGLCSAEKTWPRRTLRQE